MGTFSSETSANGHNSSKFETLIALQNDLRWLLLHSCFSKFPRGRPPRTTLQEVMHGEILGLILSHTDIKMLFSRQLPMIKYDLGIRGFICNLDTVYCYVKVSFQRFSFSFFFFGSGKFY